MMLSTAKSIIHCYRRSLPRSSSSSLSVRLLSSSAASSQHHEQALSYNRDSGIISDAQSMQPLYQTIIGIEIHAQLAIPTKLFSSAPTKHHHDDGSNITSSSIASSTSNTNVHPFDLAYPGTLPTLSHAAIQSSILSAASLNCQHIHRYSKFERKHYFYADLPHGYQITQQRWPLASEGVVLFLPYSNLLQNQLQGGDNDASKKKKKKKRRRGRDDDNAQEDDSSTSKDDSASSSSKQQQHPIIEPVQLRIERIQLEQDTGKTTTHTTTNSNNNKTTTTTTTAHINYNRAGCALIEIVSYPDLRSAHEAAGVVEKIRKVLKHVGSCDGKMEEGSLRCDLNVSIAPVSSNDAMNISSSSSFDNNNDDEQSSDKYNLPPGNGHRVEVKNLNSLRQIIAATEYEAMRQSSLAIQHNHTGRETRTFDPLGGKTICIRAKGDAIDYRFIPEPDLPPLILDETTLLGSKSLEEFLERYMPESAEDATARLVEEYGLGESVAVLIASDPPAIVLFEDAVSVAKAELGQEDNGDDSVDVSALVANFLCNDLYALIKKSAIEEAGDDEDKRATLLNSISVDRSTVDSQRLGLLIAMISNGTLTTSMAKKILTIMYKDDLTSSPGDIATSNGWEVISDMDVLVQLCTDVVHDPKNTKQLEQYKQGGKNTWKIEKFFVGKVMAQSNGNAHPEKMKEALASVLEKVVSDQTSST
eukprot:scaffold18653_cov142-Skeletonema_dohrnii-CCMP3373.AAC.1